jgi:tetratricopeptide (TPR) repeat protein
MSFFDQHAIPKSLLRRHILTSGNFEDALGILKGFSLIADSHEDNTIDLHRLVRICIQGWLRGAHNDHSGWPQWAHWADKATTMLSVAFPNGKIENWTTCAALLPHAQVVLHIKPPSRKVKERATLQFNVAWYLDEQGQYDAAEKLHRQALEERQRSLGKDDLDTMKSSNSLATVLWRCGRYDEAALMHKETLKAREERFGYDHVDTLTSYSNLSDVLWDQGRYREAETMNQRALEAFQTTAIGMAVYAATSP